MNTMLFTNILSNKKHKNLESIYLNLKYHSLLIALKTAFIALPIDDSNGNQLVAFIHKEDR
ncbi:hypothetical protein [Acetobacterium tundrae]|uniref:Uncharacterized protein n=1 Tax=Acetobacterium tundrae TaxID=132932 RepID=A0ABR6WFY3_9FIRM|nr:hypothetical protein [Acetobacterium tundrae]MBC3795444.1 hypothetical protein [Acetobacterium tundrae]